MKSLAKFSMVAVAGLVCATGSALANTNKPEAGAWQGVVAADSANPEQTIDLRVRGRRVKAVDLKMNVGCASGNGAIDTPSRSFSGDSISAKPSKTGLTEIKFRDSSYQGSYDVTVVVRFVTRERARVRVYASSVEDDPACEGVSRFHRVTPS